MKQSFLKRFERVEQRFVPIRAIETLTRMEVARRVGFVLALGATAREGLDAARAIALKLAECCPAKDRPQIERSLIAEPTVGLPAAPVAMQAEDKPLPRHAYICIIEGERERSGTRAWLAMEGPGQILRTFHGAPQIAPFLARGQRRDENERQNER